MGHTDIQSNVALTVGRAKRRPPRVVSLVQSARVLKEQKVESEDLALPDKLSWKLGPFKMWSEDPSLPQACSFCLEPPPGSLAVGPPASSLRSVGLLSLRVTQAGPW